MTHLVRILLALGLAASSAAHAAGRAQRPLEELPKAPVMIVLPADAAPRGSAAKGRTAPRATKSVPVPPERRPGYGLVEQKCGRCHGVEKALNAGYSPDEWDGYLKKKYRRAGAGITDEQAAEIGGFLRGLAAHRDGG